MRQLHSVIAFALLLVASRVSAAPKPASVFADHMVLQRDIPVVVWDTASPAEPVRVEFAGRAVNTTADANGRWQVTLPPMAASSEPRTLKIGDTAISDVLVGEVWLCAGQSNMEWALSRTTGGPEAVAAADVPLLRLATIPHNLKAAPAADVACKWEVSSPKSSKNFSAVGWWFGAKLQKELGVPVGIINDSYGGTTIQAWMPAGALAAGPWPKDKWSDLAVAQKDLADRIGAFGQTGTDYLAQRDAAIKAGQPAPTPPKGWPGEFRGPSMLWNGMVHPLLPLRFRGVAWYQGENNAYVGVADTYAELLPVFIRQWRSAFAQPDLPFVILQISAYRQPQTDPNEASGMALLREAQRRTVADTPHTALVVTLDLGESDVHYQNKQPAADRTLAAAMTLAYGREKAYSGPSYSAAMFTHGKAVVRFDAHGRAMKSRQPQAGLRGFAVAGADRRFAFAKATIDGDRVILECPEVPDPVAVRYAWGDFPTADLVDDAGLPASPFRTDDWSVTRAMTRP